MVIVVIEDYAIASDREMEYLVESLPLFRKKYVLQYKRRNVRLSRAIAYHILRNALGFEPLFAYSAQGKPYLVDAVEKHQLKNSVIKDFAFIKFNISHSKNAVCAAISSEGIETGIDVEDRLTESRARAVRKILTEGEADKRDHYTKFWTLKEAYLKRIGTGFAGGFSSNMDFSAYAKAETFALDGFWFFSRDFGSFHLSLCASEPPDSLSLYHRKGFQTTPSAFSRSSIRISGADAPADMPTTP
ncbi:MAG: 4'-phosphopantetheinyl transferase superfamily protein [Spirochaetaceae bacterium]|jgi:phosphopantetheinyl transferase|nr:4'-phosphopantetheinyl transferase superfamily protein [Spirochaetaceae bacterium]